MAKTNVISFERARFYFKVKRDYDAKIDRTAEVIEALEDVERRAAEFDEMLRAWETISKDGKVARELRDQTERLKRDIETIHGKLF